MTFDFTPLQLLFAFVVVSVAYTVRGITGFGSGLISIPLLALLAPLPAVVPVIALVDYIASLTHGTTNRRSVRWQEIWPLLPFTLLGVSVALYLFHTMDALVLKRSLGVFVIGYGLYMLLVSGPLKHGSRWWALPGGGLGGLVGTLFGTGGPFYVIYLGLRGLDKEAFRATIAMIFIIDGGLRMVGYTASGLFDRPTLLAVGAALPIMAVGMWIGGHIHTTLSQRAFQRAVGGLLLLSGAALVLH